MIAGVKAQYKRLLVNSKCKTQAIHAALGNLVYISFEILKHHVHYIEGSEDRFFLVRKIQTCHHSWPFRRLNIISVETFKDRKREEYEVRVSKEQATIDEDQIELTAGDRPSANNAELIIELDQGARFPFLNTLPVQKKR